MSTDTEMLLGFARVLGMLLVVLALFVAAFYLFRRFSGMAGAKGARNLIQVLAVHHISPKERLMLVQVMDETLLIGVTPQAITQLACLGQVPEGTLPHAQKTGFADLLKHSLGRVSKDGGATDGGAKAPDGEKP